MNGETNSQVYGLELRYRELLEIEKMRNLELGRIDKEIDEIHKTKDARISRLTEDLWHSNRRADDLDRRWNELARACEAQKAELESLRNELLALRSQRSYRMLVAMVRLSKGGPLRDLVSRRRSPKPLH